VANQHVRIALSRDLGLFTITMIGVGGMIGAGIFVLTGIAAGLAGPALVLAFLLNGAITMLTAMVYAELGSALPGAGGGYIWVREGLGGAYGFLAGWMDWFAHTVAGSLYALGFGRFGAELWMVAGLPTFGMPEEQAVRVLSSALMTLIILLFTTVNYRGASETGAIGNVVTVAKIVILGLFVVFGFMAMLRTEAWHARFTTEFMPNGIKGVISAMGLTFVAFEGYEIIAQSGEEVKDPSRNIPRATLLAVGIAVVIYVLVGVVALGATTAPPGMRVFEYLALKKEVAIVEAAQQIFPFSVGGIIMLFSGLVSTMSALNATTYSSSRVSFAMGRLGNLPAVFGRVHPKRHTPYVAVILSGLLMLTMAWALPIEEVAAGASILFLLLFLQVDITILFLRRKAGGSHRRFTIPWYPAVPIVGLICNLLLAVYLFTYSPRPWYFAIGWVVVGLLAYYTYFSKTEEAERPREILMEELLVSREYSVLVPVTSREEASVLGRIGAMLAQANGGEVLALHVVEVPPQLTLGQGRAFLAEGRSYLEVVIEQAKVRDVPVHTVIRLGRNVAEAVRKTAIENASDLILLGWPGYTHTAGRLFGSVSDPIVDDPPTEIALVRYREWRPLRSILVAVDGGANSQRAVRLASQIASVESGGQVKITLLHVVPLGARDGDRVRGLQAINYSREGSDYENMDYRIVEGASVVESVLAESQGYDLLVVGASEEPLFRNLLAGNVAESIAKRAEVTTIIVKRRSSRLHSFLRQTILEPSTSDAQASA